LNWFQIQLKRNGMWIGGGGIEFAREYGTLEKKFNFLKNKESKRLLFMPLYLGMG
jgi:hypothetical protein